MASPFREPLPDQMHDSFVRIRDMDTITPALTRANTVDSVLLPEPEEPAGSFVERMDSPVELVQEGDLGLESERFGSVSASFEISNTIIENIEMVSEPTKTSPVGSKRQRHTSRKFSRLQIVCDTPDEYFDIVPGPQSPELAARSIKLFPEAPPEKHSSEERVYYYLPKGKLKGASASANGYGTPARRKKKALLIGIQRAPNYRQLYGPYGDVELVRNLLQNVYGWPETAFTIMKDNLTSLMQPTRENVRMAIDNLVRDARPGDSLFLYFAGHASQVRDRDGDEEDGLDEALICSDGHAIIDDELHDILVKRVPSGCCLTVLFDCCHSGTGLDLPYNVYTRERPPVRPAGWKKHSDGHVILLAACEDGEEAQEGRRSDIDTANGMFTQEVVKFLTRQKHSSLQDLLQSVKFNFSQHNLYNQHPQISSSQMIDLKATLAL